MTADRTPLPSEGAPEPPPWPLWRRILFRFGFAYFVLYCLPSMGRVNILSDIPYSFYVNRVLAWPLATLTPWIGVHLFHLHGVAATHHPTGSGDTALGWIESVCCLVIAALATLLWSALDRRRRDYRTLSIWLRLLLRYTLAFTLLSYGIAKVFPLQFSRHPLAG